jgi:UDP-N-acetylglucosamine--N-acetylmuramyl-(pentapeptide) pyrophosphoryl-undecaprenol N-acetylglucosamine transferase
MIRIAYFVHGRGQGHAVRTRAVMDSFPTGYELRLFCAGPAWDVLKDMARAEPVAVCVPGKGMVGAFTRRFRSDRETLRVWSPSLVVSDGDGPSVNAAKSLGIPVVAVGHGLIFKHTHLNSRLPFHDAVREVVNVASSSWPARRRVAVHFAPVEPRTRGTYVARPDLRSRVDSSAIRDDFLLAYFRDDDGLVALERLARRGHRILAFGQPRSVLRGIEFLPRDLHAFADALARCRAVVGSAGNHLPAECAMLGIPMLALHRENDAEHGMNARLVEAAGIGIGASFKACTTNLIRRFEAELDKPRDQIAARTRAMPAVSQVVPRVVEELCEESMRGITWKTRGV